MKQPRKPAPGGYSFIEILVIMAILGALFKAVCHLWG